MPTITIYLTNDLYDKVRDAPSKTVSTALEYYFKNRGGEAAGAPGRLHPPHPEDRPPAALPNGSNSF
jgi:hypothetical protein